MNASQSLSAGEEIFAGLEERTVGGEESGGTDLTALREENAQLKSKVLQLKASLYDAKFEKKAGGGGVSEEEIVALKQKYKAKITTLAQQVHDLQSMLPVAHNGPAVVELPDGNSAHRRCSELERELEASRAAVQVLTEKNVQLKTLADSARAQVKIVRNSMETFASTESAMEGALTARDEKIASLQKEVDQQRAAAQSEAEQHRAQLNKLKKMLDLRNELLEEAKGDVETLKTTMNTLKVRLQTSFEECARTAEALEAEKGTSAQLLQKCQESEVNRANLLKEWTGRERRWEQCKGEVEAKLADKRRQITELQTAAAKLENVLRFHLQKAETLKEQVQTGRLRLDEQAETHHKQLEHARREAQKEAQRELAALRAELATVKQHLYDQLHLQAAGAPSITPQVHSSGLSSYAATLHSSTSTPGTVAGLFQDHGTAVSSASSMPPSNGPTASVISGTVSATATGPGDAGVWQEKVRLLRRKLRATRLHSKEVGALLVDFAHAVYVLAEDKDWAFDLKSGRALRVRRALQRVGVEEEDYLWQVVQGYCDHVKELDPQGSGGEEGSVGQMSSDESCEEGVPVEDCELRDGMEMKQGEQRSQQVPGASQGQEGGEGGGKGGQSGHQGSAGAAAGAGGGGWSVPEWGAWGAWGPRRTSEGSPGSGDVKREGSRAETPSKRPKLW